MRALLFMLLCVVALSMLGSSAMSAKSDEQVATKSEYPYLLRPDAWYMSGTGGIRLSPLSMELDGNFSWESPIISIDKKATVINKWGRNISLRLPRHYKTVYSEPYFVVRYPSGAVVWLGVDYPLDPYSSYFNISDLYSDGFHIPPVEFVDSLTARARFLAFSRVIKNYTEDYTWCRIYHTCLVLDKKGRGGWRDSREGPFSCLAVPKKDRRALLYVKDGVFVLAYNIPTRDYPLFEAYIKNTFQVKNRLLEMLDRIDGKKDKNVKEVSPWNTWPDLCVRQYMYYRFYRELPMVSPPDSMDYKYRIWGDFTEMPDTFLDIHPAFWSKDFCWPW